MFDFVVHEMMHALGFFHEQSRADRDKFIKIHFENIVEGIERVSISRPHQQCSSKLSGPAEPKFPLNCKV